MTGADGVEAGVPSAGATVWLEPAGAIGAAAAWTGSATDAASAAAGGSADVEAEPVGCEVAAAALA